eukprot:3042075-Lingulodinium_polyedra.AAC.1
MSWWTPYWGRNPWGTGAWAGQSWQSRPHNDGHGAWDRPNRSAAAKSRKGQEFQESLRRIRLEQDDRVDLREGQPASWKGTEAQWKQSQDNKQNAA